MTVKIRPLTNRLIFADIQEWKVKSVKPPPPSTWLSDRPSAEPIMVEMSTVSEEFSIMH